MRVSPEKIKAAILSSDNVVRSEAVLYFTSATTQDPSVMDFVIQAITKFGIDEAFKSYGFCVNLAQTTTSLRWILHHESTTAFPPSLRRDLLIQAPPQFLTELAEEIRNPEFLSDNGRECLARHLAFLETPAEKLWADLKDEIATLKEDAAEADGDDDWDHSLVEDGPEASLEDEESYDETEDDEAFEDVVFSPDTQIFLALSIHADVPEELILAGLAEDPDEQSFDEDGFEDQESLLGYAIELAGRRRIEAAVPRLFELVEHYDGAVELAYSLEKCTHSLSQIGTEPIVRRLAGLFPTLSRDGRIEATWILENNPTDESVRTTLKLFETETDNGVRCKLLSSALRNFETSAIPLAREFILGKELEPNLLETRQDLLTCCDVAGEQFPELEEWRADSENDAEYANQWYMERIRSSRRELKLPWDDAGDDANQEDQFDDEDEPAEFEESVMIMPKRPHIGRNDPCPCGSGKKFKKCCYGKNEFRPES